MHTTAFRAIRRARTRPRQRIALPSHEGENTRAETLVRRPSVAGGNRWDPQRQSERRRGRSNWGFEKHRRGTDD